MEVKSERRHSPQSIAPQNLGDFPFILFPPLCYTPDLLEKLYKFIRTTEATNSQNSRKLPLPLAVCSAILGSSLTTVNRHHFRGWEGVSRRMHGGWLRRGRVKMVVNGEIPNAILYLETELVEKGIEIFRDAGCAIALAMTLRQESSPSAFPRRGDREASAATRRPEVRLREIRANLRTIW